MAHFFGTDGIRGPIATSPLLTPLFLQHFGYIMTQWARDASNKQPHILLAQDTRASCQSIADALASGITAAGGICSSAGVMPTPALQCSISYSDQYDYGIMISASHNPASDNGIKVLTPHGKLSRGEEFSLSSLLSGTRPERHKAPPYMIPVCAENERRRYTQHICDFFPDDMLKGITVALDCAHGATSQIAPEIFTSLGATVHLTGVEPNGFNINHKHGSTVPETIHTLTQHTNADYGCSFDGDGDRVTIVTQDGVIHTGDHLLPLLVTHPRFTDQTAVVGTIMSNRGVELWLEEQGYHLLRTPVGDSHVFHAMKETNLALGGEPSGHIIVRPHLPSSDGIFTALLSIQTGLLTNNKLLKSCTLLPQATINIPITSQQDLTREPYASIIRTHTPPGNSGRCIVRYSGTEPVLRIMIEHRSHGRALQYAEQMAEQLQQHLTT